MFIRNPGEFFSLGRQENRKGLGIVEMGNRRSEMVSFSRRERAGRWWPVARLVISGWWLVVGELRHAERALMKGDCESCWNET